MIVKSTKKTPESLAQMALIERAAYHPILKDRLISIPNEHHCSLARGNRLNKMGRKRGVSDLFLAYPCANYAGYFLEMKSLEGKVSEYQEKWIMDSQRVGYAAGVAYSQDEAWTMLTDYLALENKITCPACKKPDVVKNGKTYHSKQEYRCKNDVCERVTFYA